MIFFREAKLTSLLQKHLSPIHAEFLFIELNFRKYKCLLFGISSTIPGRSVLFF